MRENVAEKFPFSSRSVAYNVLCLVTFSYFVRVFQLFTNAFDSNFKFGFKNLNESVNLVKIFLKTKLSVFYCKLDLKIKKISI